jgi:hypothetical protein
MNWVGSALDKLRARPDLVRKSFIVTAISSALNGADDHHVRKDETADDASDDDSDEEFLGFSPDEITGTAEASVVSDYSDDDDDDDDDD